MKFPGVESTTLEFKRELPHNDQIVKTIIGFCNQNGGRLIIGVADDSNIVGVPNDDIELVIESIERSVYDACSPPIIPRISTQILSNKHIIIVEVSEGMNKPYYRRAEGIQRGTYIRLGRITAKATAEIIKELEWQARGIDFECLPLYDATQNDLNLIEFSNFLNERINHGKSKATEEILRAYKIITFEHSKIYPTIAGNLLFGCNPQLFSSEAMIICSHFQGNRGRDTIATIDCQGNLFAQFNTAFNFILERLSRSFVIKGKKRHEQLEIPKVAIREALLNMIAHRNYSIKAPSKIAIYNDRIEFFSPGQFPGPLDTTDLLKGISYLRNPAICKVLREAGLIEKLGSGFIEIFSSYEKSNLQPPAIIEGENYIKCILPRTQQATSTTNENNSDELKRLLFLNTDISMSDIVNTLSISRSTAIRRINKLIKEGYATRKGQKKAVRYRIVK